MFGRSALDDMKKEIKRKYKKGDEIRYIDARDQKEYTGTFKGFKAMGGRSYSAVTAENGDLMMLPHYQIVLD